MSENNVGALPPADFWVRVAAVLIDGIVLFGCFFIFSIPLAILIPVLAKSVGPDNQSVILVVTFSAVYLGIPCLYITLCTAIWGQTLGKKAFSLKVVRVDGTKVGLFQSLWRWIWGLLSAIPMCIGFLV